MKFSQKTRDLIHHRAKGKCEKCGIPLLGGLAQIHHRRPRGMGGTKRKESGSAANGLYVHLKCHMDIESNRTAALDNGWLVQQFLEPADIPVKLWNGWFTLAADGSLNEVTQVEEVINNSGV
jgi:5-methylcytosine-specific restriction protein A